MKKTKRLELKTEELEIIFHSLCGTRDRTEIMIKQLKKAYDNDGDPTYNQNIEELEKEVEIEKKLIKRIISMEW